MESLRVAETPLNAQGGCTPHEAPPDKRPARKSCGAPSESQPSRKPQSTPAELRAARKPITASDKHVKPQTGATQAKRKPPDIMAHRADQRRGGGFRYVRERPNAAAAQHVRQESHLQNGRRGCSGARRAAFLIEQGLIDTSCLISKRYALNDILEAYRAFEAREDGCLKVVITPWEER